MRFEEITPRLDSADELRQCRATLDAGGVCALHGAVGPVRSLLTAWLGESLARPVLLITSFAEQAERLADEVRAFMRDTVPVCPLPTLERDTVLRSAVDYGALGERMAALKALATGQQAVLIGTIEAVLQKVGPPDATLAAAIHIRSGTTVAPDMLAYQLDAIGYVRVLTVTTPGQYARRGGILDVFPVGAELPVRLDLFGDEIESLRRFDPSTQRSVGPIAEAEILPVHAFVMTRERAAGAVQRVRELLAARLEELKAAGRHEEAEALEERVEVDLAHLREREYFEAIEDYVPYLLPEDVCALDYATAAERHGAAPALVILDDPHQMAAHWDRLLEERAEARERRKERGDLLEGAEWQGVVRDGMTRFHAIRPLLELSPIPRNEAMYSSDPPIVLHSAAMETFRTRVEFLAEETRRWLDQGALCLVVTDQPQRTREVLGELKVPVAGDGGSNGMVLREGRLRQGFKFDEARLYVLTDVELFGRSRVVHVPKRAPGGVPVSTLLDLRPGDYVVHVQHGVGLYRGMVKREVDGAARDYLCIQYAGTDRLYVPADQIDRVQRYIGGEGVRPALNHLGTNEWLRAKRRVKEQARALARELIELYAARQVARRPPFGEDSPWQIEMEDAFPYEPTRGQAQAIADVKADLASDRPADRLICGDVGFGKTEVAIRAAFKVVEAGKQVAVLCPTTVLAAQHHATFTERLGAYPIRIELLSRFRSREAQKRTVTDLRTGAADIVIGTHRLLSKDVEFARLGLLIIDEEQRFGVAQKERLKQLRKSVDVLTLTATPIPRTLSMALSGLREMSIIEDPPEGRLPIITYVQEYSDELVRDAILRELAREGQVYFVHNRVETIDSVAARLQRLLPHARLAVAHGQMSEDDLERIMYGFYHREYDVLVCTTIVENGLDIPNVNTIIVDAADKLGLAQLYQLRGRVGRSSRQAYAYLLVKPGRMLTPDAEQRLLAIREYTALGSGYQIALRDLEIRGAGNLLGPQQSGAMSAVGFDMYCRLLAEAVKEEQGEEYEEAELPTLDIPVTAHIPETYIPGEAERIYFYKRMAGSRSIKDVEDLQEELHDRYGLPPRPVWNALEVVRMRIRAEQAGLASIRYENKAIAYQFKLGVRFTQKGLSALTKTIRNARFTADSVVIPLSSPEVLREVEQTLAMLRRAVTRTNAGPGAGGGTLH